MPQCGTILYNIADTRRHSAAGRNALFVNGLEALSRCVEGRCGGRLKQPQELVRATSCRFKSCPRHCLKPLKAKHFGPRPGSPGDVGRSHCRADSLPFHCPGRPNSLPLSLPLVCQFRHLGSHLHSSGATKTVVPNGGRGRGREVCTSKPGARARPYLIRLETKKWEAGTVRGNGPNIRTVCPPARSWSPETAGFVCGRRTLRSGGPVGQCFVATGGADWLVVNTYLVVHSRPQSYCCTYGSRLRLTYLSHLPLSATSPATTTPRFRGLVPLPTEVPYGHSRSTPAAQ